MTPSEALKYAIEPALAMLPPSMDTPEAKVMLLSIALQESRLTYRRQGGNGPARGFWQFEQGTKESRGGVWGVYLHAASSVLLQRLCATLKVPFTPQAIYAAIENNDVLAAGLARLMLYTDPQRLPAVQDAVGSWATYLRIWRPGKPHPETWPELHAQAALEVST
ncbi:hypothetical protein [Herbaspirillum robiniae]|uniref:hypothetical protein n=1 Tax=Herbaspirillum robiniae TaxID=2014887 RepID=UPI0009A20F00|nr:hypothetical protein [Herbaspirillum robiniae]